MTGQEASRTDVNLYTVSPSVLHSWSLQTTETENKHWSQPFFCRNIAYNPAHISHYFGFTQRA